TGDRAGRQRQQAADGARSPERGGDHRTGRDRWHRVRRALAELLEEDRSVAPQGVELGQRPFVTRVLLLVPSRERSVVLRRRSYAQAPIVLLVMPALVAGIHVFLRPKTSMAGTSPAMTWYRSLLELD